MKKATGSTKKKAAPQKSAPKGKLATASAPNGGKNGNGKNGKKNGNREEAVASPVTNIGPDGYPVRFHCKAVRFEIPEFWGIRELKAAIKELVWDDANYPSTKPGTRLMYTMLEDGHWFIDAKIISKAYSVDRKTARRIFDKALAGKIAEREEQADVATERAKERVKVEKQAERDAQKTAAARQLAEKKKNGGKKTAAQTHKNGNGKKGSASRPAQTPAKVAAKSAAQTKQRVG